MRRLTKWAELVGHSRTCFMVDTVTQRLRSQRSAPKPSVHWQASKLTLRNVTRGGFIWFWEQDGDTVEGRPRTQPCSASRRAVGFRPVSAPDAPAGPLEIPTPRATPEPVARPPPASRTSRVAVGGLTLQERPHGGKGLLLTPGVERVDPGALALLLQFINAVGEVAQARQHGRPVAIRGAVGILAQRDIAPGMRVVFNRGPMPANHGQHPGVIALALHQAGRVTGDLQRGRLANCQQLRGSAQ